MSSADVEESNRAARKSPGEPGYLLARFEDTTGVLTPATDYRRRSITCHVHHERPDMLVISARDARWKPEYAPARLTVDQARGLRDAIDRFLAAAPGGPLARE